MKHIKSKMLFENVGYSVDDIKDILLELNDMGFTTNVEYFDSNGDVFEEPCTEISIILKHSNYNKNPTSIEWSDISESIKRLLEYLKIHKKEEIELYVNGTKLLLEDISNVYKIRNNLLISTITIYFNN